MADINLSDLLSQTNSESTSITPPVGSDLPAQLNITPTGTTGQNSTGNIIFNDSTGTEIASITATTESGAESLEISTTAGSLNLSAAGALSINGQEWPESVSSGDMLQYNGTAWESLSVNDVKNLLGLDEVAYEVSNVVYVRKNPHDGEFSSIQAALDSITTANQNNIFLIDVGPGYYFENTVKLKPYVIVQAHQQTSVILPSLNGFSPAPDKNIIEGSYASAIIGFSIAGSSTTHISQTSGVLETGKTYEILNYQAGDDFTNVGAPRNESGVIFTATGSTPAVYTNGTEIQTTAYAIFYESTTPSQTVRFNVKDVSFYSHTHVCRVQGIVTASILSMSSSQYGGPAVIGDGFEIIGGTIAKLQMNNCSTNSSFMTAPFPSFMFKVHGSNSYLDMSDIDITTGGAGYGGNAVHAYDGANVIIAGGVISGFACAIFGEDIGAAKSVIVNGCSINDCTKNLCIEDNTSGYFNGHSEYSKNEITKTSAFFISYRDANIITVAKKGGDFSSVESALAAISDASSTNAYTIQIVAGIYIENQLVGKQYVTIIGVDSSTTILQANDPNDKFIIGCADFTIANIGITGATGINGVGLYVEGSTEQGRCVVKDISFMENTVTCRAESNVNLEQATIFLYKVFLTPLQIQTDIAFDITTSNGGLAHIIVSECYPTLQAGAMDAFVRASGIGSTLDINNVALYYNGGTGTAIELSDGATSNISDVIISGYDNGIHIYSPSQTSGTLIPGVTYVITNYVAGDSFTNVGATVNQTGTIFVATADIPSVWTNGSELSGGYPVNATISGATFHDIATMDVLNEDVGAIGYVSGVVDREKVQLSPYSSFYIDKKDLHIITVAKQGGDFTSVKDAMDFITPSVYEGFVIEIGPGIFVEDPFVAKPYVTVIGSGLLSTILVSSNPTATFITTTFNTTFRGVSITGASGVGGVGVYCAGSSTIGSITIVESEFANCETPIKVDNVQSGHYAILLITDVVFNSGGNNFKTGLYLRSGLGVCSTVLNSCKTQILFPPYPEVFIDANGPGCNVLVNSTVAYIGGSTGKAFVYSNGVQSQMNNTYTSGWECGIEMKSPSQTSGIVMPTLVYTIENYVAGDDFTNVGATLNQTGEVFVATGYVPAVYTNGSTLVGGYPTRLDASGISIDNTAVYDICVTDIGATGHFSGYIEYEKININETCSFFIFGKDSKSILVAKKGGDFSSIKDAVDFLQNNTSSDNRYVINVGPGIFIEDTIDMTNTPYVSVVGSNIETTMIQPLTSTQHLFILGVECEVSFLNVDGVGAGYAAFVCNNSGDYSQLHKITITNSDIGVIVAADDVETICYVEYVDINSPFSHFVQCLSGVDQNLQPTLGTAVAYCNLNDSYAFYDQAINTEILYIVGENASVNNMGGMWKGTDSTYGIGCYLEDGAEFTSSALQVFGLNTAISVPNVGAAQHVSLTGVSFTDCVTDLVIIHTQAVISCLGVMALEKINNNSSNFSIVGMDSVHSEVVLSGIVKAILPNGSTPELIGLLSARELGIISGGVISESSGLDISISDVHAYLKDGNNELSEVLITTIPDITLPANQINFVYINTAGSIVYSQSEPSYPDNLILGRVATNGAGIIFIDKTSVVLDNKTARYGDLAKDIFGQLFVGGSIVSEGTTAYNVDVTGGVYYVGNTKFAPSGGSDVAFDVFYRNGSGGWTIIANQTTLPSGFYDNGTGTLVALTTGERTKHTLYVCGDSATEKYFLVYGQDHYANDAGGLESAIGAPIAQSPVYFVDGVVGIAALVVTEGAGIEPTGIISIRPFPAVQSAAAGTSNSHSSLLYLTTGNAGHTQFYMLDGSTPLSGTLNVNSNNITNVGTINGVTVETHASRHNFGGSDGFTKGTPAELTDSTNVQGASNISFSAGDHTHSHGNRGGGTLHSAVTTLVNGFMIASDKSKLDGIQANATANSSDSFLLNRTNHTGTQLASTISDFSTAANAAVVNITGNAATATALFNPRTINGVAFDGTANITVTAAAGTLTGTTLNATVVTSSLTSVGTLTNLTVTNPISGSVTGNAATATALQTARTINGVSFDGTANITVTAAAGTLTGTTLNSAVVTSSLTSVGTLLNLTVTNTITGSVSGSSGSFTGALSGDVTGTQSATAISNTVVTSKLLTGFTSGAGTVTGTDSILTAINKLNGNIALKLSIAPRIQSVTTTTSLTPTSNDDLVIVTALAGTMTINNPTGTPAHGQKMILRIKDNGTSRTISYGSQYRAFGTALPTSTTISKTLYIGFIYNSTDTRWDMVATTVEL